MTRKRLGSRRALSGSSSSGGASNLLYLPQVGPYAHLARVAVAGLSSGGWDQSGFRFFSSQSAPIMNNVENIIDGGGGSPFGADLTQTSGCFVWMNRMDGSAVPGQSILDASGANGDGTGNINGAPGGNGGSGGGGANSETEDTSEPADPAPGGSGNNGTAGVSIGAGSTPAPGGLGWGLTYSAGYSYPHGGNAQSGELGGPGYGGGGASGAILGTDAISSSTGSGGGGGGLLVGVFNYLIGGGAHMTATGGVGGAGDDFSFLDGSSGGGGAIWLAARSYDGGLTPVVTGGSGASDGNAVIYAILPNNTLVIKSFNQSWNYT